LVYNAAHRPSPAKERSHDRQPSNRRRHDPGWVSAVVDVPHEAFAKIIAPFKDKAGIRLLDTQRNEDHNRLVVTVIGSEEALTAMTINGAAALDRANTIGSIDPGKQADLIVLEFPSYAFIPYHIGVSTVEKVIKRGAIVFDKTRHEERDDVC